MRSVGLKYSTPKSMAFRKSLLQMFVMHCNINQEIISLRHLNQLEKKIRKVQITVSSKSVIRIQVRATKLVATPSFVSKRTTERIDT